MYIWGCQVIVLKNIAFLSEDLFFTLSNSVDPDEMPHYATFLLDLHCL